MVKLMSDKRQAELVKAAADCIELMNVGIEPNAALTKIAEDSLLTDKEVTLVSHAVNNSKQLSHLLTSSPEEKGTPFLLTNADVVTKQRYSKEEEMSHSAKADQDQPDAVGIKKNLDKIADSMADGGDYRSRPEADDTVESLRKTWGIDTVAKVAEYEDPNPFAKLTYYRIGIEEAKVAAARATTDAADHLEAIAGVFRQTLGPDWLTFAKAAEAHGIDESTLDLIYSYGKLDCFNIPRETGTKTASARVHVTKEIFDLVKRAETAETLWKQAADNLAAHEILTQRYADATKKLAEGVDPLHWALGKNEHVKADLNLGGIGESLGSAPMDYFTPGEDPSAVFMEAAGTAKPEGFEANEYLDKSTRQDLTNIGARAELETLMQDPYVKEHPIQDVIEAYNQAKSVNSGFGQAEMLSYIRQHLASRGAIPLDLQVRASQAHRTKGQGE